MSARRLFDLAPTHELKGLSSRGEIGYFPLPINAIAVLAAAP